MATLEVPGRKEAAPTRLSTEVSSALNGARVEASVSVDGSRSSASAKRVEVDAGDDKVVVLDFEGDVRQYIRADQFVEDYNLGSAKRGDGSIQVPTRLSRNSQQRGILGDLILKKLRVIGFPLEQYAARAVAEHFESKINAGLHSWHKGKEIDKESHAIQSPDQLPKDGPILLFLHGTASSTIGSFGGLAGQADKWQALRDAYPERVFAFEHATLSKSPGENVRDLLQVLPHDAELHIVSHSRGGLLGELLCRSSVERGEKESSDPFDTLDLEQFESAHSSNELPILNELNQLLKERRPRVTRFVRVACPAAGTILASDRLDRYFSILVSLVGKISGLTATPMFSLLESMAIATARERTNPQTLPGLESMDPESALIRVLNRPDSSVDADLSVIAGDIQGSGIFKRIAILATDLFYRQQHDLVVHTKAMYGGTPRVKGTRYYFDKGDKVSHFNYFKNPSTSRKLVAGLVRADNEGAGFRSLRAEEEPIPRSTPSKAAPARAIVYLLPGIMGSQLSSKGDKVWVDPFGLIRGHLRKLRIDRRGVEATGIMRSAYAKLVRYLASKHYEVIAFPYDWRRPLTEEARKLAHDIETKISGSLPPVRIVAHSMGGLLARAMIAESPRTWTQIKQRDGRLVQLGTPNQGSFGIANVVLGRDSLLRNLARLDFKHNRQEVLDIVRRFPGMLELLPMDTTYGDYLSHAQWQTLHREYGDGWLMPEADDLRKAAQLREVLKDSNTIDPERMTYVAGRAPATPIGIRIDTSAKGEKRIVVDATAEGDGRVPWVTGTLPGVKTWYTNVVHGSLADDRRIFPAIVDLMERGETDRISTTPPVTRGSTEIFPMPPDESPYFPSLEDLEASVLGCEAEVEQEEERQPIALRISHGNLRYAKEPLLIGHYQGDSIAGAEHVLDRCLGGKLRERHNLALYPDKIETSAVVLEETAEVPGAIVVGLGNVGGLTPGDLRRTVAKGLLHYCLEVAERDPDSTFLSLNATSLLVGSGDGGLPIRDCITSIVEGARDTNRALSDSRLSERLRIGSIEFVELHLDRAVRASKILHQLSCDENFSKDLDLSQWRVNSSSGGLRRVTYQATPDWWSRLEITERKEDRALRFVSLTDRARAEARLVEGQRTILDSLLRDAVQHTDNDPGLAHTLFELLYPNELKDAAPQDRDTVLVLDKASARYPWELLRDSMAADAKPLSVRAGLVRQLETWSFRQSVKSASADRIFVVGDPPTESFARLDGAKREAERVKKIFEDEQYEVEPLIRVGFREVLDKLFDERGYRVMHLAGHGVYEHDVETEPTDEHEDENYCKTTKSKTTKITGMVLGDGVFLTPACVEQMRIVPELVFINCCHLGLEEGDRRNGDCDRFHQLAANLGTQLIQMGAHAVIAAGWAVDDEPAEMFAREFYEQMLAGIPFGESVRIARAKVFERHGNSNTWGAYQCYGDPGYVLTARQTSSRGADPELFSVVEEAIASLDDFAASASRKSDTEMEADREWLESHIVGEIDERWSTDGTLLAALGNAYGQVGLFEKAIAHYQRARTVEDGRLSVKAIEQSANLRCRWTAQLFQGAPKEWRTTAQQVIKEAIADIELLLAVGETVERRALLGSAHKRHALTTTGQSRTRALRKMRDEYKTAHDLALARDGRPDQYPTLQWITARILCKQAGESDSLGDVETWLDRVEESIAESEDQSFWGAIAQIDCDLARHLFAGGISSEELTRLGQRYLANAARGSHRDFSSVLEHIAFLAEMYGEAPLKKKKPSNAIAAAMKELHNQLTDALGGNNEQ